MPSKMRAQLWISWLGTAREKVVRMEAENLLGIGSLTGGDFATGEAALREALKLSREVYGQGGATPVAIGALSSAEGTVGHFDEVVSLSAELAAYYERQSGTPAAESFGPYRDLGTVCIERRRL